MATQAQASELNKLMAKYIATPLEIVGEAPPNLEAQTEEAGGDTGKLLDLIAEPSTEYYGKIIKGLNDKVVPWLERIYDKSDDAKMYPFELTHTFVMAWLSHVFTGGVSLIQIKDPQGNVVAMGVINLENSLFSSRQRLSLAGYAGDTPEDEAKVVEVVKELGKAYRELLGNEVMEVVLPEYGEEDIAGLIRRKVERV